MITIGSLFSGVGGLDRGLELGIGDEAHVVWQVEIDPFCRRVLERHWPHATRHDDIRTARALPPVDVVCGGFPCQDVSIAGRNAGLDGERSGLWAEMARVVGELRPSIVVVENVPALLARGLGRVLADLSAFGFDAEWDVLPAAAVGAPHFRDRLFVLAAHTERLRLRHEPERDQRQGRGLRAAERGHAEPAHDGTPGAPLFAPRPIEWGPAPPAVRRMDDGLPPRLDGPRRRRPAADAARLKALGNAVVPQVAEVIGRRVREILSELRSETP